MKVMKKLKKIVKGEITSLTKSDVLQAVNYVENLELENKRLSKLKNETVLITITED